MSMIFPAPVLCNSLSQRSILSFFFTLPPYCREEGVQKFTGKTDPIEVLRTLQKEKDKFKKPKERVPPHAMLALEWGLLRP